MQFYSRAPYYLSSVVVINDRTISANLWIFHAEEGRRQINMGSLKKKVYVGRVISKIEPVAWKGSAYSD